MKYVDYLKAEIEREMKRASELTELPAANLSLAFKSPSRHPARACELLESAADDCFTAWQHALRALALQEALDAFEKQQ